MQPLKVLQLIPSLSGGAGRAAWRIHQCLQSAESDGGISDVDSTIRCLSSPFQDCSIQSGYPSRWHQYQVRLRERWEAFTTRSFRGDPGIFHSFGSPGLGLHRVINQSSIDLVHLHWCGGHLLSIEELGQLRRPLLWTLHDQWAFCGAEHYASVSLSGGLRFIEGYRIDNRPTSEQGPDLNRSTWQRKRRAWRRPFQIVAPSRWLADGVRQSALLRGWPVVVIPHPLDLSLWQPSDQRFARQALQLPLDRRVILFGVDSGCAKPNKGADLLLRSLQHLQAEDPTFADSLHLAVFGQQLSPQQRQSLAGLHVQFLGRFHDDVSLRLAYSAADVLVMPSRLEAFGLTAAEAHACGTPVVCFDSSGLRDIVDHQGTGWRAVPFEPASLARGIAWVLADPQRRLDLGQAARQKALQAWAPELVRDQYVSLYRQILCQAPANGKPGSRS